MTNSIADRYDHIGAVSGQDFNTAGVAINTKHSNADASLKVISDASVIKNSMIMKDIPADSEINLKRLTSALDKLEQKRPDIDVYISDYSDILKYIGAILIKNATAMRKAALDDRLTARTAARDALLGQSGKLHEAAANTIIFAAISLAVGVAVSLGTVAVSALSLKNATQSLQINKMQTKELAQGETTAKGLRSLQSTTTNEEDKLLIGAALAENSARATSISASANLKLTELNLGTQRLSLTNSILVSISGAVTSSQGITNGMIKTNEADGILDASKAQMFQGQADTKKELYDKIVDIIQQSISLYEKMLHSETEAMRAITRA